ncbi:MAG: hemolysin III family protein [Deltaproteobacteria bacterium]|nr:hemolysin III family protein [Deltaproteobacteria bacterium]
MSQTETHIFENQSRGEEIANSITHGIGALAAIAATVVLIVLAALSHSAVKVVGVSIFGATMVMLYTASTLYHGIQSPGVKHLFHIFDHSAIFLLIAGTYTPISLVALQGGWGWSIFGVTWGLAALGIVVTAIFFNRARYISLALYIAMGWLVVFTGPRLFEALSFPALVWLFTGGVLYTGGVIFYRMKQLHFHHMIWHLFVLAGSACHFFMMMEI